MSSSAIWSTCSATSPEETFDLVTTLEQAKRRCRCTECTRNGYFLFLTETAENPDHQFEAIRELHERRVDGIVLAPVPDPENRAVTYLGLHKSPVVFVDRAINRHFDHFVEVLALLVENGAGKSTCVKVFLPASVLQLLDTFTSKASLFSCVHRWARSIAASPSCTSTRARLETFRSQRTFLWATQKKGFFGHPESRSNARGDAPAPKNPRVITAKSNRM